MRIKIVTPLLVAFVFAGLSFGVLPNFARALPASAAPTCGTTWAHTYVTETNPFPLNTPEYDAWASLYGDSHTVETTYPVSTTDGIPESCVGDTTTPTAAIIAVPSAVSSGGSSSLSWNSTYTTSCTGTNFSTGGATSGSLIVSPGSSKTYAIVCTDGSETASASASITVDPAPAPTASLSANPGTVNMGGSSMLSWTSANASSCSGSGLNTTGHTSGAASTGALNATSNYSILCIGSGASASAYATVHVNAPSLTASCTPSSPTPAPDSPVTWTVTTSGGNGPYAYSWSGTDSLSGTSASVSKTYSTSGIKTASVVITDTGFVTTTTTTDTDTGSSGTGSMAMQGGMQCSGGTKVGSYNDTEDGVGFGGGADATLAAACSDITPAGGCCNVEVREVLDPTGHPVNTFYFYNAYTGASLVQKDSHSTITGGSQNQTNYNYFAGTYAAPTAPPTTTTTTTTSTSTSPGATITANCSTVVCTGSSCPVPPVTPPPTCTGSNCPVVTPPPACTGANCPTVSTPSGSCTGPNCPAVTTPPGSCTGPNCPTTTPGANALSALLTAFPTTVVYGAPSILSWTSAHAVSCEGGNFNTRNDTAGTLSVKPTATTLYSLDCKDASGNHAFSTATINVVAPTLSISGSPQLVRPGDSSAITWSVSGHVDSCTVSGPGLSSSAVSGSKSVIIQSESLFTLSCAAGSLHSSVSTSVKILPTFREQ